MPDLNPSLVAWHALQWIGTPWAPGQSCRGAGADCVGLVRGVWRELTGISVPVPGWRDDWPAAPAQPLALALPRYARPVRVTAARPGHLAAFRRDGRVVHLGVITGAGQYIEAATGRAVRMGSARAPSSCWALLAHPDAVTGPAGLTPGDCLAVILPPDDRGHVRAQITEQVSGDLLAVTGDYPTVAAAVDHLGAIYPFIETVG